MVIVSLDSVSSSLLKCVNQSAILSPGGTTGGLGSEERSRAGLGFNLQMR
jgi:hypothetical protein